MKKYGLPLATSLLFSGSYIAAKYATNELTPIAITFLRYVLAAGFLTILAFKRTGVKGRIPTLDKMAILLLGLFGIVGYHYFFFLSLRYTEVANTAIINALSPIVTGVMAGVFLRERLAPRNYAGVLLAVCGTVFLIFRGDLDRLLALSLNRGDGLMLLSVVSWATYAVLVRRLVAKYASLTLTLYATYAGLILLLVLLPGENLYEQMIGMSTPAVVGLIYMGLAASGLGYLLYNSSIKALGPTKTAGVVNGLLPVFVAFEASLIFRQPITFTMVASILMIAAGLFLMMHKADRSTA